MKRVERENFVHRMSAQPVQGKDWTKIEFWTASFFIGKSIEKPIYL